jgi:Putative Ig domain
VIRAEQLEERPDIPTASDANGNTLAFSITGKPTRATFSTATGTLTGTPTTAQAGTYENIVISVSDCIMSPAMPAYLITVTAPTANGSAALSWTAPTQNTDGSALTDLAGYRVYHGTSPSALSDVVQVPGATSTSYT